MFETIITAVVSSLLTVLGTVLIARYSKRKEERDTGLVSDYIKITDMTGAQLERKINQVDRLEAKIDAQDVEIETIKESREESKVKLKAALIESRDIRTDNAEKEKRITKLESMIVKQSEYIDEMKNAMQAANISVPLNGELLRSAYRLKLSIEERERLKAGK